MSETDNRETYPVHHFIQSVCKSQPISFIQLSYGEIGRKNGHQVVLITIIKHIQEGSYEITILANLCNFQT